MDGQHISSHRWTDRLILIKVNDSNNDIYIKQIDELKRNLPGLSERKIIVYQVNEDQYKKGFSKEELWQTIEDRNMDKYFKKSKSNFEIVLIGLDGGVKLRSTELLESQRLFSKIDAMPMRISEMMKSN